MKSCLIIDDSKVIQIMARGIVEDMNFAVDKAEDGEVAHDHCQRPTPDVIPFDWNMSVMNGMDFLRALRRSACGDQPVVVLCTTENDIQQLHKAIGAGANEYIMKLFDSEIVQTKFEQVGVVRYPDRPMPEKEN